MLLQVSWPSGAAFSKKICCAASTLKYALQKKYYYFQLNPLFVLVPYWYIETYNAICIHKHKKNVSAFNSTHVCTWKVVCKHTETKTTALKVNFMWPFQLVAAASSLLRRKHVWKIFAKNPGIFFHTEPPVFCCLLSSVFKPAIVTKLWAGYKSGAKSG